MLVKISDDDMARTLADAIVVSQPHDVSKTLPEVVDGSNVFVRPAKDGGYDVIWNDEHDAQASD